MSILSPQPADLAATDRPATVPLAYCGSPYAYRRRRTHVVMVGDVAVGGDHPIRVQSMTTTRTLDTDATVAQAERLVRAGCEIVRITAPTTKDARNLREIKRQLYARGIRVPLVADIHFSPDAALEAADHVEKVRVNPGNYADSRKFAVRSYTDAEYAAELQRIEERFAPLVLKCKANGVAMRVGTNHGSLSDRIVNRFGDTPEGMVESALEFLRICEKYDYFDVILSMKASNVKVMIAAYRLLAARMDQLGMTYPFHLGVTEAGNGVDGRLKSTIGIGSLLADGIGDTIRVSLTEEPEEEIPVAFHLALGIGVVRANAGTGAASPPAPPLQLDAGEGGTGLVLAAEAALMGGAVRADVVPSGSLPVHGEGEGGGVPVSEPRLTGTGTPPLPSPRGRGETGFPLTAALSRGESGGPGPYLQRPVPNSLPWDPFHYSRRPSRPIAVGPVTLGEGNVVGVLARATSPAQVLRWASPGARRLPRPDLVEWPLADADGLTALRALRARWDQARAVPLLPGAGGVSLPKLGLVASGADADLLAAALPLVDAVLLQDPTPDATAALARATRAAGQPLWLETRVTAEFTPGSGQSSSDGSEPAPVSDAVARLLAAVAAARAAGQPDLVLAVSVPAPSSTRAFQRPALPLDGRPENVPDLPVSVVETARGRGGEAAPHVAWQIYAGRLLAAALATAGDDAAVFLRSQPSDDPLIDAALPLGSLLCDGVGDLIQAGTPAGGQAEAELSLNVLQAAGTRLSKTDYVACPSCGRTLFDLQSTTERIKSRTAHLAGVKIAIMGCIVNGPGEMADADFGYVGGSPGHVNLYVGKACVERNVPAEVADEHLVALIKARGRWEEPEEE